MDFLNTILTLLIFLISLGFLICLHELGHLSMAKLFKVYCYEYSIGMGPLVYKHKRKNGETQFSIRALPVGGYVSMAGDEEADSERTGKEVTAVPKSRTISGIHWGKQVVIMAAGVAVNFLLAFLFFFASYVFCQQPNTGSNAIKLTSDSKLTALGIKTGDQIAAIEQEVIIAGTSYQVVDKSLENDNTTNFVTADYYDINRALNLAFQADFLPKNSTDTKIIHFTMADGLTYDLSLKAVEAGKKADIMTYTWDTIGLGPTYHYLGFVEGTKAAAKQWAYGSGAMFVAIGQLFTPQGWASAGGIVSVFRLSEKVTAAGLASYLNFWGLISVNLAVFNLIPIPGLDGWQIIVAAVEGTTKKKIPNKVKTIVTYIGLGLLFGLMILLLVKDIFFPVAI